MMLVYLTTGECVELTLADRAQKDDGWLTCLDADGRTIAAFAVGAVEAFTSQPVTAKTIKQEVCEEVSVPAPA
jgi:hypothetical protein